MQRHNIVAGEVYTVRRCGNKISEDSFSIVSMVWLMQREIVRITRHMMSSTAVHKQDIGQMRGSYSKVCARLPRRVGVVAAARRSLVAKLRTPFHTMALCTANVTSSLVTALNSFSIYVVGVVLIPGVMLIVVPLLQLLRCALILVLSGLRLSGRNIGSNRNWCSFSRSSEQLSYFVEKLFMGLNDYRCDVTALELICNWFVVFRKAS